MFHYELEFIHDGNGRMGRLWQTVILRQEYPVFEFLPVESLIKQHQQAYYNTLAACDTVGESTQFIEFMLSIIDESLKQLLYRQPVNISSEDRIKLFHQVIKHNTFARKEYMQQFRDISTATASRDLKEATQKGVLLKEGEGRNTLYKFC